MKSRRFQACAYGLLIWMTQTYWASAMPDTSFSSAAPVVNQQGEDLAAARDLIKRMPTSAFKAQLLVSLALKYHQNGDAQTALVLLQEAKALGDSLDNTTEKVTALINLAQAYAQLDQLEQTQALLQQADLTINGVEDLQIQSELRLNLAFAYDTLGQTEQAQQSFQASLAALQKELEPKPKFPFKEEPIAGKLGLAGQVNSFRDTTAFLGVSLDFYKQWKKEDLSVDGTTFIDFDSSRLVNNFRPGSLSSIVYRDHFNDQWSFFSRFFVSTNQDLYASSNNDEDLEIIAASYNGVGLNLWRGDNPKQFLDFQMGIGPRYEYNYVNFQQFNNRVSPVLGFILYGRGLEIGILSIDSTFYVAPIITDFNRFIVGSDSRFNIPLSKHWTLTNRLFMRYENAPVVEETPNFDVFFTTGLEYKF